MSIARAAVFFGLLLTSSVVGAQTIPLVTSTPMPNGNTEYALGIQILMVMTVLTLLPAMLITMTAFTRILIVLAILRQALGTQQTHCSSSPSTSSSPSMTTPISRPPSSRAVATTMSEESSCWRRKASTPRSPDLGTASWPCWIPSAAIPAWPI